MLADANLDGNVPRHKLPANERRAAIIEAAIDLFSQKGFRGTTTRELAATVGVSEPVLYQHFATKRELHAAIVDELIGKLQSEIAEAFEQLAEELPVVEFFEWLGMQVFGWYLDRSRNVRLMLFSALEGNELAQMWHERAIQEVGRFVFTYVQRQIDSGRFREIPADLSARAFLGMVADYGLATTIFVCPDMGLSPERVISSFVDIYLHGVERREALPLPA